MLLNLDGADSTILSCFFFVFLIIDLYFLIHAVIAQICNPIAELVIPIGTLNKKVKAEIEIHPVIVEVKSCTKLFVLFTHQLILLYFFKEIIFSFLYVFQSKFLIYDFFHHVFKVITSFKLN